MAQLQSFLRATIGQVRDIDTLLHQYYADISCRFPGATLR